MLHVVSGPSSLFHSVNLIPVSMAVNLLFLCLSYCLPLLILHYHHAQLPHCFTASLKPICFINLSYLKTDSTDCHMDQFLRAKLVFVFILFFPCLLFLVQCCRLSRLSVSFLTHHKPFRILLYFLLSLIPSSVSFKKYLLWTIHNGSPSACDSFVILYKCFLD